MEKLNFLLSQNIDHEQNVSKSIGLRKVSELIPTKNRFHLEGFFATQNESK